MNQSWEMLVTDGQTDQGMDGQKERQADGWTDRERDGRMDKSDFIARCPTKVARPTSLDNFPQKIIATQVTTTLFYH